MPEHGGGKMTGRIPKAPRCINAELVLLNSKKFQYMFRSHPNAVHQDMNTFWSKAELVRRRAGREDWLVLRENPDQGLPLSFWKDKSRQMEPDCLTFTGQKVRVTVIDAKEVNASYAGA